MPTVGAYPSVPQESDLRFPTSISNLTQSASPRCKAAPSPSLGEESLPVHARACCRWCGPKRVALRHLRAVV